jgi:hypothetical protein
MKRFAVLLVLAMAVLAAGCATTTAEVRTKTTRPTGSKTVIE